VRENNTGAVETTHASFVMELPFLVINFVWKSNNNIIFENNINSIFKFKVFLIEIVI
jgi:hypothetical protein